MLLFSGIWSVSRMGKRWVRRSRRSIQSVWNETRFVGCVALMNHLAARCQCGNVFRCPPPTHFQCSFSAVLRTRSKLNPELNKAVTSLPHSENLSQFKMFHCSTSIQFQCSSKNPPGSRLLARIFNQTILEMSRILTNPWNDYWKRSCTCVDWSVTGKCSGGKRPLSILPLLHAQKWTRSIFTRSTALDLRKQSIEMTIIQHCYNAN